MDAIGYVWRCVQCLPTDRDRSCVDCFISLFKSWEQSPKQWPPGPPERAMPVFPAPERGRPRVRSAAAVSDTARLRPA